MVSLLSLPASLLGALERTAGEASLYVVGGFVRDALLGRPSPDLDIAVGADPAAVARRLGAALGGAPFPLGAEHGVHRVTLRRPVDGIGHVDVSALRGTVEQDLALRDFTVNAIAWRPGVPGNGDRAPGDELVDPFDGAADLRVGVLRLVSEGAVRDDPLRGLRAVRFAAELGFRLEEASAAVIRRDAALLSQSAGERQRDELMRVLETPVAGQMLRLAEDLGLLDVLLPELTPGKGCVQPKEHCYDVFDHNMETVVVLDCILHPPHGDAACTARHHALWDGLPEADILRARYMEEIGEGRTHRALLKLAGLLHDVAKPQYSRTAGCASSVMTTSGHVWRSKSWNGCASPRARAGWWSC
jgi:tRNA nucleotidyltransferase/poly(A) polymerase